MRRADIGRAKPSPFASGDEAKFEVSATFGEGAIVALVDPETSAIRQPLYDAESTSGRLSFSDGEETTIVWTPVRLVRRGVGQALPGSVRRRAAPLR